MTQRTRRKPPPPPPGMEHWTSGVGQFMVVHHKDRCSGRCAIHNPSDTHMKNWPTLWREDRALMERLCPHGIGHPDPDQYDFWKMIRGDEYASNMSTHGCDGCCHRNYIDGEVIVHEIANPRKEIES